MSPSENGSIGGGGEDRSIDGLAELEQDVSPEFLRAVRKKIYRRTATGQVMSFSWNLPKLILLELVSLIGGLLAGARERAKL